MDRENGIKIAITGALGLFSAYAQELLIPMAILIGVMAADYLTGMIKAGYTKTLNSRIGVMGVLKKLAYLFIVAGAMVVDYIIKTALFSTGINLPENFAVALLVIFWLIINELISILENVSIIGVPMPAWLIALVKKLKIISDSKAEEIVKENTNE